MSFYLVDCRLQRARRGNFSRLIFGCVVLGAIVGECSEATAGFFRYATTVEIGTVAPLPTGVSPNPAPSVVITTALGTKVNVDGFTVPGTDNLNANGAGTDIVFGLIDALVGVASPAEPLSIDFIFHVTIDDYPTNSGGVPNGTAIFDISGTLGGTLGPGLQINLNSIAVNPIAPQVIGSDTYTLAFNPNINYAAPGTFFAGRIGAHVTAVPVPEPATATLLGLGTIALATPALRRWRGRRVRCGSK